MNDPTPIFDDLRIKHIQQRVLDTPGGQHWIQREVARLEAWMAHPATRAHYLDGWD